MADRTFLEWPFFEAKHRTLSEQLEQWCEQHLQGLDHDNVDDTCKQLV